MSKYSSHLLKSHLLKRAKIYIAPVDVEEMVSLWSKRNYCTFRVSVAN